MASEIRTLGRHAVVYGAGIAVGRLAGFIMLPIYTSYLTEGDYGTLQLLTLTVDFLGTIASAGVAGAVYKFYTDAETQADKNGVISTASLMLMAFTGVLAISGALAAPVLSSVVLGENGDAQYFRLFFVIYFLQSAESIPLLHMRARQRSGVFALTNVVRLIVALGLNVYFVVFQDLGILGVLYSSLITGMLFATGLLVHQFREVGTRFVRANARALARFGAPLVPWTLSNFLIVFSDRYFLRIFSGDAAVGVYSLAFRFTMLLHAFGFRPFQLVWGPQRFEVARRPDGLATIRRLFRYLNIVLGFMALVIALFAGDLIRIMARRPGFHEAANLIPIMVGAQILYHLVSFPNLSMLITERTKIMGRLALLVGAMVLALNFALIPRYGMYGAAYATLIAYALRFLIVLAVGQRVHRFEYGWRRIALIYLVLAVPFTLKLLLPTGALVASIGVSTALAALGAVGLYALVLSEDERRIVRAFPAHALGRLRRQ
ncbi:MAG: oligosaccharide flippase family protein [Gemmatimonadota bacterium]